MGHCVYYVIFLYQTNVSKWKKYLFYVWRIRMQEVNFNPTQKHFNNHLCVLVKQWLENGEIFLSSFIRFWCVVSDVSVSDVSVSDVSVSDVSIRLNCTFGHHVTTYLLITWFSPGHCVMFMMCVDYYFRTYWVDLLRLDDLQVINISKIFLNGELWIVINKCML